MAYLITFLKNINKFKALIDLRLIDYQIFILIKQKQLNEKRLLAELSGIKQYRYDL